MTKQRKKIDKEFGLPSWAINNKTTIYVMMVLILFSGISFFGLAPNFPKIFPFIPDDFPLIPPCFPWIPTLALNQGICTRN